MRGTAVLSLVVILSLAGCRREANEPGFLEGAEQSATDSATHPGSPGGAAVVPSTASGSTVLVALEDNRIIIQDADRIPPGPAVLTVNNAGTQIHNLVIEGEGISRSLDANLAAGGTTSIDVKLQQGTYTLYCPIPNHREKGESVTLVIRPPAAAAPTSTVDPVATTTS
jgi:hypothetical protein